MQAPQKQTLSHSPSPNTNPIVVDKLHASLHDAPTTLDVETPPVVLSNETRTKFIRIANRDYFNTFAHMAFDLWAVKVFEENSSYYKNKPESAEEYYRIVELVVTHYRRKEPLEDRKKMMEEIKNRYSEDLKSEAGMEFKTFIGECLAHEKFKAIRRLSK